jgi:hypothetical protein
LLVKVCDPIAVEYVNGAENNDAETLLLRVHHAMKLGLSALDEQRNNHGPRLVWPNLLSTRASTSPAGSKDPMLRA